MTIESASGAMNLWYGLLTIEVSGDNEVHAFQTTVGVVGEEWSESILGHTGFLEHLDATFSHVDKLVMLIRRT